MSKRILVAYFSASGTTALTAKNLAEAVGADLYEIRPRFPTPMRIWTGRTKNPVAAWK